MIELLIVCFTIIIIAGIICNTIENILTEEKESEDK